MFHLTLDTYLHIQRGSLLFDQHSMACRCRGAYSCYVSFLVPVFLLSSSFLVPQIRFTPSFLPSLFLFLSTRNGATPPAKVDSRDDSTGDCLKKCGPMTSHNDTRSYSLPMVQNSVTTTGTRSNIHPVGHRLGRANVEDALH